MKLYLKILQFLKPFWKLIIVSIILTFTYVMLNNISLWVSVDFMRELFSPNVTQNANDAKSDNDQSVKEESATDLLEINKDVNLYKKINKAIKSVIIQDNKYDTLKVVCLVIFLSFLLKNINLYFRKVIINFIQLNIIISIRNRLQSVILRLPLSYFEKRHTGELTSIVFNDVYAVNTVLNNSFGKMILTPIQVSTNLIILLLISWKLSLITFTIIPISGFLIIKIGQSIRRKSRRVFKQISYVMSAFQEAISSIRIVKAFTSEDKEINKFQQENRKYFKTKFRANKLGFATSPLNETLGILILVLLLWYGGNLVYSNSGLNAEDFIRYLVFLFTMFQPLKDLSGLNNVIQTGLAASERIFGIIDSQPEVYDKKGAKVIENFKDSIVIDHVFFQYNTNEREVLNDINLSINKGENVAFVGHSGSGKTTLVNLLPRFYDVKSGQIKIDGIDIRDYKLISLRKQMGIVTQDTFLFNDTVRANIAYGMDGAITEEQLIEAAIAANAWEFIEKMDKGLETIVGERGFNLSGGQKQRLSIARAILKNPPILILDEATSALDTESEKLVQEAINKLMKNRTVLVIAHRLSTIIHADKIVVNLNGKLFEQIEP